MRLKPRPARSAEGWLGFPKASLPSFWGSTVVCCWFKSSHSDKIKSRDRVSVFLFYKRDWGMWSSGEFLAKKKALKTSIFNAFYF